jgi:Uma2 family endonuclease
VTVNLKPRLFTVEEYALMIEAGVFAPDERVELIEGEIIAVSPANPPHASRIARLTTVLVRLFGDTHEIRVQLPLTLGLRSEPEPDFALVRLEVADGAARHPAAADLVIEISDSSLRLDRNEKASLYAKAGVMDYWILNLKHHRLEVRRDAWEQEDAVYGWDYATVSLHSPDQRVSPLFAPQIVFEVCDLLGPKS